MAAGALVGGWLRDWTNGFDATMGLSLVLSLVGVLSIVLLPATSHHPTAGLGGGTAPGGADAACASTALANATGSGGLEPLIQRS